MRIARSRAARASSVIILALAAVVVVAAIFGVWYMTMQRANSERESEARARTIGAIGLDRPVSNRLDPHYKDADGDLVADTPTDAKDLLDPPTLKFSYIAVDEGTDEFKAAWADFLTYLSKETGKPVEYLVLESEAEQLRALRDGQLHVTAFNTGRVPLAVDAAGFVPVATLADAAGNGKTHTEIIVAANSPIQTLEDLKGHELALTEVGSNSGYKAPLVLLKDHNLLPERDYLLRYTGSHDASIRGINDGKYQAAAVAADMLMRLEAAGDITRDKYRSLFKSENFPPAGLGYAYNLKPELTTKIKDALLKFEWKGTSMEKFFNRSGQTKLVPATYKDDWAVVRRIDDAIGYKHEIPASPTTKGAE